VPSGSVRIETENRPTLANIATIVTNRRSATREPLAELHRERPDNFQETGGKQECPGVAEQAHDSRSGAPAGPSLLGGEQVDRNGREHEPEGDRQQDAVHRESDRFQPGGVGEQGDVQRLAARPDPHRE
jgi:hypothetical protein